MILYCRYCKGTGKILRALKEDTQEVFDIPLDTNKITYSTIEVVCEYCQGKGYIEHHKLKTAYVKKVLSNYELCYGSSALPEYQEIIIEDLKRELFNLLKDQIKIEIFPSQNNTMTIEASLTVKENE